MKEKQFQYYTFVSYKSEDEKWAKWLQRKIENFRLPAKLCKESTSLPKRLKTFRYTTDIRAGELRRELEMNLEESQTLIVVCSRLSAQSEWVGVEIDYFISLGRTDRIFLFIIDGVPYSEDPALECVHQVIKERLPEMLGANINEAGDEWRIVKRERAFVRLLSSMVGITFDSLWKRQKRKLIKQIIIVFLLIVSFIISIFLTLKAKEPYVSVVSFVETTPPNNNLPLPYFGGSVMLELDNQRLHDTIFRISDHITFPNIPAKYKNKMARLTIVLPGFQSVDTSLFISPELSIPVARDSSFFGNVVGVVLRKHSDTPIQGALITIDGCVSTTTDQDGRFSVVVPIPLQNESYNAVVQFNGNQSQEQPVFGWQNNSNLINILYLQ